MHPGLAEQVVESLLESHPVRRDHLVETFERGTITRHDGPNHLGLRHSGRGGAARDQMVLPVTVGVGSGVGVGVGSW